MHFGGGKMNNKKIKNNPPPYKIPNGNYIRKCACYHCDDKIYLFICVCIDIT